MREKVFVVKGMHCRSCEELIKDSLMELEGVQDVSASHKEGSVKVTYDESLVGEEAIRNAIRKEGYEAA